MQRMKTPMVVILVLLLVTIPAQAAEATAPMTARLQSAVLSPHPVHLLSSTSTGVTFEVLVPWEQLSLESVTVDGKLYQRVSLPDWSAMSQAGAPALPFLAVAIGAPFGASIVVQVTPGKIHSIPLSGPVLPAVTQVVEWGLPTTDAAPLLPEPVVVTEPDPTVYSGITVYPDTLAEIASDGLMRQQRVVGVMAHPVQFDPASMQITVYESLRIELRFESTPLASVLEQPAVESAVYEELFQGELLNHEVARVWRSSSLPNAKEELSTVEISGVAALPWTPPNPGWRVKVRETGLYALTFSELAAAGLPVGAGGLNPRTLRLYNMGDEVAIYVSGQNDATDVTFGAGDTIVFYGQALTSKYSRDNVYWLTYDPAGASAGLRMGSRDGSPGTAALPAYYTATLAMESNAFYIPNTPGDDGLERWFWAQVIPPNLPSWTHSFSLAAPYDAAPATLTLWLLGYLDNTINPDHHVIVNLNGTPVGEARWDGIAWQVLEMTIPEGILTNGANTLQVVCPNDTGVGYDIVYPDRVQLEFASTFQATQDELAFTYAAAPTHDSTWRYRVAGFTTDQLDVYDVTDPTRVSRISGVGVAGTGPYSAEIQDTITAGQQAAYWVMARSAYRAVFAVEADTASNLTSTTIGADYLVITHANFSQQAAELRDWRSAQGLRAVLVDVQDIYDQFGYGIMGALPIHDFLSFASSSWQAPAPSYVVLVGDGTYDPKDYLNQGKVSYIPPYLAAVDPWITETAGDNRYVTLAGADTLPDMMLGRLAVNTSAEAAAFVSKIIAYEQNPVPGDWQQRVLAVADNADTAGDFAEISTDLLAHHLPDPYQAEEVYYGVTHTNADAARTAVINGINAGRLIVNYIGHASQAQWANEGLFKASDVTTLTNGGMMPIMLPMTCYDGYYHSPAPVQGKDSTAEVVTRAAGRGAVASWSPTGLGVATGHDIINRAFFDAVFKDQLGTVGAGTAAGKLALYVRASNLDLLDTYLLFGDPATRLPTACASPSSAVSGLTISSANSSEVQLAWDPAPDALLYQVWWNGLDPYFVPTTGMSCSESNGCAWRSATSFKHASGLSDTTLNNSYLVLPVSACGAVQGSPSNRVGEFDFSLVPGD